MRNIKFLCLFLMSGLAFAIPQTKRIGASVTNIPTTFSRNEGSLVISEFVKPTLLIADNRTSTEIELNCAHKGAADVPTASEGKSYWVNANITLVLDNPRIKGDCYIRSASGSAISSGTFIITVDGD